MYVYGFVRPTTGDVQWLLLPTVSAEAFQIALAEFARAVGASPHKRILLVIDGAGWHVARDLQIPDGIRFVFLPAYSPELQPAERLWPLLHESYANRPVETLQELEDCLIERCRDLANVPDEIRPRVDYHWWPDDAVPDQ
jgi:transposase